VKQKSTSGVADPAAVRIKDFHWKLTHTAQIHGERRVVVPSSPSSTVVSLMKHAHRLDDFDGCYGDVVLEVCIQPERDIRVRFVIRPGVSTDAVMETKRCRARWQR